MQHNYNEIRSRILDIKLIRTLNKINRYLNKNHHLIQIKPILSPITTDGLKWIENLVMEKFPPKKSIWNRIKSRIKKVT